LANTKQQIWYLLVLLCIPYQFVLFNLDPTASSKTAQALKIKIITERWATIEITACPLHKIHNIVTPQANKTKISEKE